jgi:inner membrane protein
MGINHKVLTFVSVYAFSDSILASVLASVGSLLPDALEGPMIKKRRFHRTITHWWALYLVPILFLWFKFEKVIKKYVLLTGFQGIGYFFKVSAHDVRWTEAWIFGTFFVLVGCLMHVVQDALTGRVPFLNPFRKDLNLKVARTNSFAEYLLVLSACALLICVKVGLSRVHAFFLN